MAKIPDPRCTICRATTGVPLKDRKAGDIPRLEDGGYISTDCRLKHMDPFNPYYPGGTFFSRVCKDGSLTANITFPNLQEDRRKGLEIYARMVGSDCPDRVWYKQTWPHSMVLRINGTTAHKIQPPEPGHKRRDEPLSVTVFLRTGANTIEVSSEMKKGEIKGDVVFALVCCQPHTPDQIVTKVSNRRISHKLGHERFLKLLRPVKDQECSVVDDSRELRLMCPIGFERVNTPARGIECDHLRCFDLNSYVHAMRKMKAFNKRWCCPICQRLTRVEDLVVDDMMARILKETEAEELVFNQDGSWSLPNGKLAITEHSMRPDAIDLAANGKASPKQRKLDPNLSEPVSLDTPPQGAKPMPEAKSAPPGRSPAAAPTAEPKAPFLPPLAAAAAALLTGRAAGARAPLLPRLQPEPKVGASPAGDAAPGDSAKKRKREDPDVEVVDLESD